jgi:hypothetical protein
MENIIAVVDNKKLQEKANEYAQKGAEEVVREFYTGYNSPYKKAIEEDLKNKGFDSNLELPDVVAQINAAITNEIDRIANTAVSKTFVPLVTKFLTRAEPEVNMSEILREFINYCGYEYNEEEDESDYEYSIVDGYEDEPESCLFGTWFNLSISSPKKSFEIRLCKSDKKSDKYEITSLPRDYNRKGIDRTMKLSLEDGATLELPFTPSVLQDDFMSYIARLLMAESKITLDVDDFDEDMFPQNHCHC